MNSYSLYTIQIIKLNTNAETGGNRLLQNRTATYQSAQCKKQSKNKIASKKIKCYFFTYYYSFALMGSSGNEQK